MFPLYSSNVTNGSLNKKRFDTVGSLVWKAKKVFRELSEILIYKIICAIIKPIYQDNAQRTGFAL